MNNTIQRFQKKLTILVLGLYSIDISIKNYRFDFFRLRFCFHHQNFDTKNHIDTYYCQKNIDNSYLISRPGTTKYVLIKY